MASRASPSAVRHVVRTEQGRCRLNLDYFTHHSKGVEMTWEAGEPALGSVFSRKMTERFGAPRLPRAEIQQRDLDLAASVQLVLEENYFALLNFVQKQTRAHRVCLAGGVALNCVANGKILERTNFREVYVQPAAHDAGTALGAALYVQHQILNQPRSFVMRHVYYGPEYTEAGIQRDLAAARCRVPQAHRGRAHQWHSGTNCRGEDRGLVSGAHGIRSARLGQPQHPGRPAQARHEEYSQQPHQVPRTLPSVLPLRSWRSA